MNTMKREDMLKEKADLETHVLNQLLRASFPVVSFISAVQRLTYLCNQIDKSTPRPGLTLAEDPKEKDSEIGPLPLHHEGSTEIV